MQSAWFAAYMQKDVPSDWSPFPLDRQEDPSPAVVLSGDPICPGLCGVERVACHLREEAN